MMQVSTASAAAAGENEADGARRPLRRASVAHLLKGVSAAALLAGAAITLAPAPAMAACDNNAPASGQTVTCDTSAPNPDTQGVQGSHAVGVTVNVLEGAKISRTGDNNDNDGIITAAGATINISGQVTTDGYAAFAVYADDTVNDEANPAGRSIVTVSESGVIETSGWASDAIRIDGGRAELDGSITTRGDLASGISVFEGGSTIRLGKHSSIVTEGTTARGIYVEGGDNQVEMNGGSITTSGVTGQGIAVFADNNSLTMTAGSITTTGEQAAGILVNRGSGNVLEIDGNVSVKGVGAAAVRAAADASATAITVSGRLSSTQGNAIEFAAGSGTNRLELLPGFAISGNVVGAGEDTLAFGSAGSGSTSGGTFDLSRLGGQYTGFDKLEVTEEAKWWFREDASAFAGATTVNGALVLDGKLGGATTIGSLGVLRGAGTLGDTTAQSGAYIMPGRTPGSPGPGTLSFGSLVLEDGANLLWQLNTPDTVGGDNDLIVVKGGLTLDGNARVAPGDDFGNGVYTLIQYGKLVADNGLELVYGIPDGYDFKIVSGAVNAGAGSVRLLISTPTPPEVGGIHFWDGAGPADNGVVEGGAGVWNAASTNWTDATGATNRNWVTEGFAVFDGTGGVVKVEGTQTIGGMQFLTDGYKIVPGAGGVLDLGGSFLAVHDIRVDGGVTARIGTPVAGAGELHKVGPGTLVLTGQSTDDPGNHSLNVNAGTLRIEDGGMFAFRGGAVAGTGGKTASVVVTGADSTLKDNSELGGTSSFGIGSDSGRGLLLVEDGGFASLPISFINGGSAVTVTGAGSSISAATGINVRSGTLEISDGGTVYSDRTEAIFGHSIGGRDAGDTGTVLITGAGSILRGGAPITIGINGQGAGVVSVADGGTLRTPEVRLALGADTTARLIVGGDGAAAAPGLVDAPAIGFGAGDGALVFNHTSTGLAFAPALTSAAVGTHAVEVLAGVTRLTADSSAFDGTTSLRGGRLDVTGTLGGAVFVTGGGTLGGTGGIGALTVAGGRIAPGLGVPGTLTVQGDVTFDAGSTLAVRIAGDGGNDRLAVTGTATVAGDVEVTALDPSTSYENGQAYTILTATDGVSGTFAQALSKSAFLTPTLTHNADDVVLTIALGDDPTEPTKPVTGLFTTAAETPNQEQAATGLDGLEQSGDALAVYNTLLMMNAGDARRAFDLSSGEIHAAGRHVIDQTFALFNRTLRYQGVAGIGSGNVGAQVFTAPLGYGPAVAAAIDDATTSPYADTRVRGAWAAPLGGSGQFDDDGNAARLDWWNAGLAGGYEGVMDVTSGEAVGGFGFGYIHARGTVDDRLSTFDSDGFYLGAYGAWVDGPWNVAGSLSYGANRVSTERNIAFMGRTAKANYWTHTVGLSGEASYAFDLARTTRLAPLFTLDASWSGHGGFTETGAGALNLTARSESWTRLDAGLGIALTHTVLTDSGRVTLEGRAVWEHAFADVVPSQSLVLAGSPTGFTVLGPDAGRDRLRIGAGVSWNVSADVTLRARYDGLFSGNQANHSGFVGLNVRF